MLKRWYRSIPLFLTLVRNVLLFWHMFSAIVVTRLSHHILHVICVQIYFFFTTQLPAWKQLKLSLTMQLQGVLVLGVWEIYWLVTHNGIGSLGKLILYGNFSLIVVLSVAKHLQLVEVPNYRSIDRLIYIWMFSLQIILDIYFSVYAKKKYPTRHFEYDGHPSYGK